MKLDSIIISFRSFLISPFDTGVIYYRATVEEEWLYDSSTSEYVKQCAWLHANTILSA